MGTPGVDIDSLHLAIQFQREDLEELVNKQKGKEREDQVPDTNVAIDACRSELAVLESHLFDLRMCNSIAKAVRLDGKLISETIAADDQVAADRQFAQGLKANGGTPAAIPISDKPALDDEFISKLEALYLGCPDREFLEQPESSAWAASRAPPKASKCISCQDEYSLTDVARCPCSHEYCRGCLALLFEASMKDETLFPPRCCTQPIPIDINRIFLPPELVGEFNAKKVELETIDRTYCHDATCSTFVPLQFIKGNVAHCVRCSKKTCSICKGASHQGECPQDPAFQEILRVATENGWQRCQPCGRIVELDQGCNHMTCPCGHHFCYDCGMKWKQFQCAQWEENRLYARAARIVDRGPGRGQAARAGGRENAVQAEMRNLVANYECDHNRWTSRRGRHQCEECHHMLPE
ncbi:Fc.00g024810.m01.CDS01 [Cosmosporella sp. VM-42]